MFPPLVTIVVVILLKIVWRFRFRPLMICIEVISTCVDSLWSQGCCPPFLFLFESLFFIPNIPLISSTYGFLAELVNLLYCLKHIQCIDHTPSQIYWSKWHYQRKWQSFIVSKCRGKSQICVHILHDTVARPTTFLNLRIYPTWNKCSFENSRNYPLCYLFFPFGIFLPSFIFNLSTWQHKFMHANSVCYVRYLVHDYKGEYNGSLYGSRL